MEMWTLLDILELASINKNKYNREQAKRESVPIWQ